MSYPDLLGLEKLDAVESWEERYESSLMGVFGTPQELLVAGRGCWVTDSRGNELLDMLGGIAVNALGHNYPALTGALAEQLKTLGHISNLFTSVPQMRLAELLLHAAEAPEGSTVFFANSGSEANEAALKAVLRHRRDTGRTRILALEGGFHGRTAGALSLTHKPAFREPFGPLIEGIEFLPPDDLSALEHALDEEVAGIFLEPIQGEAGVRPLSAEYLLRARRLASQRGALLVLDEVQTGIGRTGDWFRHQGVNRELAESGADGVVLPDLMTLAKGLGSGVPIGALMAFGQQASELLGAGQHGSTFGGNPLAALAGQVTLETIEAEGLLENAQQVGTHLATGLRELDAVTDVRQYGLHLGIDLDPAAFAAEAPAKELVGIARERQQLIINATGEHTLRLAPPLILSEQEADLFLTRFGAAVRHLQETAA
ncbi:acetylornithine transaminase [Nesterenkonia cremea]|uniref:Acetylornithine aminotransferase n=1 Tax=Nesterenkonia cremea TaxID=1882340 RepID=A0A917ETA7_9MICC|nr:acetylornithine transaminase [Nesterenkonia cremea]GGE77593.1 acetylornithine aminotransferase [Nesterenkonia cremea]